MGKFVLRTVCGLLFILTAASAFAEESEVARLPDEKPQWLNLEPGLEFCEFFLNDGESILTVLRIDPEKYDFVLASASDDGRSPRSLDQWANEYDLTAAINASMYREDRLTSTGYMRNGKQVNNPRIAERFGAFLVAGPKREGLPKAMILDKDREDWRELLDAYEMAVQNYRMINSQRRILWSPGGPLYSISAIAEDGSGRLLFLHSHTPVEAYSFAQQLLHLPLDVRTVMYVEGGGQAGLVVRAKQLKREFAGFHAPSLLITGDVKALLPNVIGIVPKKKADAAGQ